MAKKNNRWATLLGGCKRVRGCCEMEREANDERTQESSSSPDYFSKCFASPVVTTSSTTTSAASSRWFSALRNS